MNSDLHKALMATLKYIGRTSDNITEAARLRAIILEKVTELHNPAPPSKQGCAWADEDIDQCDESGTFCDPDTCAHKQLRDIGRLLADKGAYRLYLEHLRTGRIDSLDTEFFSQDVARGWGDAHVKFLVHWAAHHLRKPKFCQPMIITAAKSGNVEIVQALLDNDIGTEIFIKESEAIADVYDTWLEYAEIVKLLISVGADLSASKFNALEHALAIKHPRLFDAMSNLPFSDEEMNSVLRYACSLDQLTRSTCALFRRIKILDTDSLDSVSARRAFSKLRLQKRTVDVSKTWLCGIPLDFEIEVPRHKQHSSLCARREKEVLAKISTGIAALDLPCLLVEEVFLSAYRHGTRCATGGPATTAYVRWKIVKLVKQCHPRAH